MLVPATSGWLRLSELDQITTRGIEFLAAADKIIRDESEPIAVRYAALQRIDDAMGIIPASDEIPESAIQEYIDNNLS